MKTMFAFIIAAALLLCLSSASSDQLEWDTKAAAECRKHCVAPTVKESKSTFCRKYLKVSSYRSI